MTTYKINLDEFNEALENNEEFLLVFEDGEVYYQDVNSQADDADYSMIIDSSLYDDVDVDREFLEGELNDWNSTFPELEVDIQVELAQMSDGKSSEAQKRASRAYEGRNPEKTKIDRYKRNARTFFRHYATKDDIEELIDIYKKENPNYTK